MKNDKSKLKILTQKIVYFATHNKGKFRMAQQIIAKSELDLNIKHLNVEYPEDKSQESFSYIAQNAADFCANKFKKNVFVTDVGLEVESLNNFPGINTAFTLKRIGIEGIIKLLRGVKNRNASASIALSYCEFGRKPHVWENHIKGKIPLKPKGNQGFGWDSIFIPEGFKETFAQNPKMRNNVFSFKELIIEMARYINQN